MRKIILILVTLVLICTAYAFPAMASEKNNTSEILSYGRGVLDAKNVVAGLQLNNESLIFTVSFDSKYEPKKISDDSIFVSRPPTLLSIFDDLGPVAQKILDRYPEIRRVEIFVIENGHAGTKEDPIPLLAEGYFEL